MNVISDGTIGQILTLRRNLPQRLDKAVDYMTAIKDNNSALHVAVGDISVNKGQAFRH